MGRNLENAKAQQFEDSLLGLSSSGVLVEKIAYTKPNKATADYLVIQNNLYDEDGNKLHQLEVLQRIMKNKQK